MTYKEARAFHLAGLEALGWDVHYRSSVGKELKTPYAVSPNGQIRLDFRPQAIHMNGHTLSYDLDIRRSSTEVIIALATDRDARDPGAGYAR